MPKRTAKAKQDQPVVWTVGHSTRSIEALLEILAAGGIKLLADVRRFPGSRRHPHFGQAPLAATLADGGIIYRHFEALGGRRTERLSNSPNTAWRVESFNAYADYMQSAEFRAALEQLTAIAEQTPTAVMCSEALPQKCHRRLIADALLVRGWQVRHLLSPKRIEDHALTRFARVAGLEISYPDATLF